jgi:hypothetical protein
MLPQSPPNPSSHHQISALLCSSQIYVTVLARFQQASEDGGERGQRARGSWQRRRRHERAGEGGGRTAADGAGAVGGRGGGAGRGGGGSGGGGGEEGDRDGEERAHLLLRGQGARRGRRGDGREGGRHGQRPRALPPLPRQPHKAPPRYVTHLDVPLFSHSIYPAATWSLALDVLVTRTIWGWISRLRGSGRHILGVVLLSVTFFNSIVVEILPFSRAAIGRIFAPVVEMLHLNRGRSAFFQYWHMHRFMFDWMTSTHAAAIPFVVELLKSTVVVKD